MKKIALFSVAILALAACTDNQRARQFGGTERITLPKGQKLLIATWKDTDLWYLTEPMPAGYSPQVKTFHEESTYGVMHGTVIFTEQK